MNVRTLHAALTLARAPAFGAAQDKVVYHIKDAATHAVRITKLQGQGHACLRP